jgi:hypothetical protein
VATIPADDPADVRLDALRRNIVLRDTPTAARKK